MFASPSFGFKLELNLVTSRPLCEFGMWLIDVRFIDELLKAVDVCHAT